MRSLDGGRAGRPGVGIVVSGTGHTGCGRVYFFFEGTRIGTGRPDASGAVRASRLSLPGDAGQGEHRIISSCKSSGSPAIASTTFFVTDGGIHRSGFVTSLAQGDISLDLRTIAASAAAALAILALFAFPFELFNSTVEENYDEIRHWFRLPARAVQGVSSSDRTRTFVICTVLAGVVLGFLSPDFGMNGSSAVLVAGFSVALVIMSLGFSLPAAFAIHRRTGEWGKPNFLPGSLAISVVLVVLSRMLEFQPGYFYGAMAGLAFASALSARDVGRITAENWLFALVLSMGAWALHAPVAEAASQPDAGWFVIALETCLVLIFLWGIESLAVAMLPMRFLDGRKIIDWNRPMWSVLMFLGVFAAFHVLFSPESGYIAQSWGDAGIGVMTLFVVFGAISVGLWAYFRYRPGARRDHGDKVGSMSGCS